MRDSRTFAWKPLSVAGVALIGFCFCQQHLPALGSAQKAQDYVESGAAGSVTQDVEFARLVKEWTTRPEFLSPLVDHLPVAAGAPSPKDILGHHIGEPRKLTYHIRIVNYYRSLASKSPRVKVTDIGRTDEGRELIVVAISGEESMRDLERNRASLASLADPRRVSEAEAQAIISLAKPIYHLIGGLHSSETGAPEMLMELAYRLAVEDSPLMRQIRDNVIVTITPVAEPDGHDRYVDWYCRYLVDITDERDRLPGPPFWGKYVYHDNNRDINFSQAITRALLGWYLEWHPPIIHDLHESVPFLYTFSGQAPQNPTLDPILFGELPWFANFEMAQVTQYGMPGVWTHAFVDAWSPGYLGFMASNHNGMLRMYETFVEDGGLLITLCSASLFPIDSGLIRTVDTSRPSPQFYAPGPIVEAEILRPDHPIFYGYSQQSVPVCCAGGPLFQVPQKYRERQVLVRYAGAEKSVLSGLMKNPSEIKERPAIPDVPAGKGRVIMFGTNPCYRWQNHGEFNMLFNAILNYNDLEGK